MTNLPLVTRKLAVLEDHVRRLRERRPETLAAFARDSLVQDAISMSILVVVQEAMDIALHIASDKGWELAATYRETFGVLARHGVLSEELATALATTAMLRSRLAHGVAAIDHARVWAELPAGVATMESFAAAIATFLMTETAG